MIPPNYMPPVPSQAMHSATNKLNQDMQNMRLCNSPPPNSRQMSNQQMEHRTVPPSFLSPQHRGHSTTVTYSGAPRSMYPYANHSAAEQSHENNNQYNKNLISPNQPHTQNGHREPPKQNMQFQGQGTSVTQQAPYGTNPESQHNFESQAPLLNMTPNFGPHKPSLIRPPLQNLPQTPSLNIPQSPPNFGLPKPTFSPPQNLHQFGSQPPALSSPPQNLHNYSSQLHSLSSPPNFGSQSTTTPPNAHSTPLRPRLAGFSPPLSNQPEMPPYSGVPPGPQNIPAMQTSSPYGGPQAFGPGNYPYAPQNLMAQTQQQPQRFDIDQMPSNVHVREDDKKTRGGYYSTDVKGQPPPLVTTNFVTQDRGMCSPRFIRSSVYCLPNQPDMLKQTGIPFAVTVSPFSRLNEEEVEPPLALFREEGPLRCKRCKAYVCPFMTFMEGGRCFQCAFCKVVTEVPQDYFCFLDGMGERTDKFHRPELCLGSYEFLATKEYCRNDQLPNPPAYIFMIEVSSATFRNGFVPLLCENMKTILEALKNDEDNDTSKLRVGFVTYNSVLHFYNMKKNLSQPHIMVLSDVHNAFVPLLEGFLVTLSEAEALVDCLMEHIPRLFVDEPSTEIILGPVIQVGLEALKNANCSGKLLIFQATIPHADAPGKLLVREGQKLLGSDKQKTVLNPQHDFYYKLAEECVAAGCAVDLFLFPSAYMDIASMAPLCRHTGGQIYKYTYFQSHIDGECFLRDLERNIETPTAFDAVLRVRTSAGISPVFYYGNFYMSNTTDVELSAVDGNKSVTIELAYDDKIPENETIHIQAALLYTSITGERRIRVHNLAVPTSVGMPDIFKCCEIDTMINFFAKQAVKQVYEVPPQQIKSNLINRSVKILSCYRKHCASNSSSGQLVLPDTLKLLPLHVNCLLKSDAIGGGSDMSLDDRSFALSTINIMDVKSTAVHFYPTLIPLHDVDPTSDSLPTPVRCSIEKLHDNGAYILENGIYMFLWIGQAVSSDWLQNVFGVPSANQVDKQKTSLPELDTQLSKRIYNIIEDLQEGKLWCMRLRVMVQGDKLESVFRQFLVEDRGVDGSASYVDFLCHLHREISKNL